MLPQVEISTWGIIGLMYLLEHQFEMMNCCTDWCRTAGILPIVGRLMVLIKEPLSIIRSSASRLQEGRKTREANGN